MSGQNSHFQFDAAAILGDPAASDWLKRAIADLQTRDPVDALNDVEALFGAAKARLEDVTRQNKRGHSC